MADVILRLRVDPATGKRELVIDYTSDADALPVEHEDAHRQLANKVVEGGLRSGKVEVARGEEPGGAAAAPEPVPEEEPAAQPVAPRR
ncbi:MAG TPA: hypothetical protein VLM79_25095 [Kofleriaceae bacterium]|nr:hypothetical protein [Kofleriaceae bacterium]